LYQLPSFFQNDDEHRKRLEEFISFLPRECMHVFEFRHASWFNEDLFDLLRRRKVGFCSFDSANLKCPLIATAPFAYMRFHGTDKMYASNYPDDMLIDWARRLKRLAQDCTNVYVYFNNDHNAYAVQNAKRLMDLLQD
jgi:uncharacterized protein YecE (DUF72 family)